MKRAFLTFSLFLATSALASSAAADTWFVSPTGTATSDCATRSAPCSLPAAGSGALAGDTVILMGGVYDTTLYVSNSGTAAEWITFEADECATPIIEGAGPGPMDDSQTSGVTSSEAEYVRFKGIVVRGWNIGFGNGWADGTSSTAVSNGHWEIENCISYANGRTGFTFFSADSFSLKNSIAAHNGTSQLHSWSSGVTLFEATGTNLVEGNVSFENTDAQKHTDGSGFIVDEASNNATFINNIAFGNAGSCLRLTKSSGTKFINNTCYHNSQFGSMATGPSNPGELYFTNGGVTQEGVSFMNNVIVGTGQAPAGSEPVLNQPPSGWSNNVVGTGAVTYFTDPEGTNPNFVPGNGDTTLTGKGAAGSGVPSTDIGFDPKCIVKRTPVMVGDSASESSWKYDIDIEYIQSIGGVAKCFNAATRGGTPDIGGYAAGAVMTISAGSCIPPKVEPLPVGGAGGTGGTGGVEGVSGAGGLGSDGGMGGSAGDTSISGATMAGAGSVGDGTVTAGGVGTGGGSVVGNGATAGVGFVAGAAGVNGDGTGVASSGAGVGTGDMTMSAGGGGATVAQGNDVAAGASGCSYRVPRNGLNSLSALAMLGLVALVFRRRQRAVG